MKCTVVGGRGYIGSQIVQRLRSQGADVFVPERQAPRNENLGHVVYAAGVTSDFRQRPLDAMRAHVSDLLDVLADSRFESLLYLSTARTYAHACSTDEGAKFEVDPGRLDDVYNLSKLTGECACLAYPSATVRVVRLSNLFGGGVPSSSFLQDVVCQALAGGSVAIRASANSAKDYVHIDDAVDAMLRIVKGGCHRVYNVASGDNVSNADLARELSLLTNATFSFGNEPDQVPQLISVDRLVAEFGLRPRSIRGRVQELLNGFAGQEVC